MKMKKKMTENVDNDNANEISLPHRKKNQMTTKRKLRNYRFDKPIQTVSCLI